MKYPSSVNKDNSGNNDIVEQYQRNGYVIVPNVLDEAIIEQSKEHIQYLQRQYPELRAEQLATGVVPMDKFWLQLVSDPRLLNIAEQFIGPDIALFASHYIAKPPRTGLPVLWHQDGSYWPLEPMKVITLWLALDDSDPDNGCMRVIPRTQGDTIVNQRDMKQTASDENVLNSSMDLSAIDASQARDLILRAGDVSIHNPNIVHGSEANKSDRWRRGLTIRYIPTTTRITDPNHSQPFLLKGQAIDGINHYDVSLSVNGG